MKFESTTRRLVAFALYVSLTCSVVAPGFAQGSGRQPRNAPSSLARAGNTALNAIPTKRAAMVGEGGRRIPYDIPVRVLDPTYAKTGKHATGTSRAQIGGANGANVLEQLVSVTFVSNTSNPDDRTPNWSNDERFLYFASNRSNTRYNLYQVTANPSVNPAVPSAPVLLTPNNGTYDYLFPAVDKSGTRIAFLRSSDNNAIDATNKKFDLFVSNMPSSGTVDETPGGASALIPLTVNSDGSPRSVVTGTGTTANIINVRRAAWVGSTDLVFSAQLQGKDNYDLFQVNTSTRQIIQLTDSPADEQNPAVSPDGLTVAFDSDTNIQRGGATEAYAPGIFRSLGNPSAIPPTAPRNGTGTRAIFTMALKPFGATAPAVQPLQFSGRLGSSVLDARVSDVQPAWSSDTQNVFTGSSTQPNLLLLSWSSNRKAVYDPADPTRTVITRFDLNPNGTNDVFFGFQTLNSADPNRAEDQIEEAPTQNFPARQLNTDDPGSVFNDLYPTWSPLISIERIGIQSNRTGIYTKDSYPVGGGWTAGANDIMIASVIDITAPSLLRFDTQSSIGEVVHINIGDTYNAGGSVRSREDGVLPGSTLFFTVRVEDRESGMRQPDANGQTPKAVFLQFKNPNSKYQSTAQGGAGVEHKEFVGVVGPGAFANMEGSPPRPLFLTNLNTGLTMGTEYECQAISAADRLTYFSHNLSVPLGGELYTPSIDDASAFAGGFNTPLDGTKGKPNVWLELVPLKDASGNPVRPADGQGGILYGAKWQIPNEASDWYIDVILYDNAVNPFNTGLRSNFIIYDNVWGFSSAQPISPAATDILVVNDYMLGQKFFSTRFTPIAGNQGSASNLTQIAFGAEAYFTDIDVSLFPSYSATGVAPGAPPAPGGTTPRAWDQNGPFTVGPVPSVFGVSGGFGQGIPNTLGVNSYMDELLTDGAQQIDGKFLAPTARYSIYRILSRGPVPQQLLNAYLPQRTQTPHDSAVASDPLAATPTDVTTPRTVLNANRAVVWGSPFTGDLFVGPGTVTDINTQNTLTNFVAQGGRLFISGQDIAFALAGNGQASNFFQGTLGATYTTDQSGAVQAANGTAVTAAPYDGYIIHDSWDPAQSATSAYGQFNGTTWDYAPPNSNRMPITNLTTPVGGNIGDGAFTSLGGGFLDGIGAGPGARLELNYNTGIGAMVSKYTAVSGIPNLTNFLTFGKGAVVYGAFGFESLSNDWYTYSSGSVTFIASRGKRAAVMHNIVDTFRTGTLTGQLIDDTGSPVTDALVRAIPTNSTPDQPALGTAVTDGGGRFTIVGLPPGAYVVYGYKAGYYTQHTVGNSVRGGWRSSFSLALKRANPGQLTGIPNPSNTLNPQGGIFKSDGTTPVDGVVEIQARRVNPDGSETVVRTLSSDGDDTNNTQQATQFPGVNISSGPRGAYQFPTLLIDKYRVIANPTTLGAGANGTPIPNPVQGQGGTYRSDLTPDVRVGNTAQSALYRLGAGTTIDNSLTNDPRLVINENQTAQVDFLLTGAPQSVLGRVTDIATGAGIANATVTAVLASDSTKTYSGTTDANGDYTIVVPNVTGNLLPEGSYNITASAPGYASATQNGVLVGGDAANPKRVDFALTALPPGSVSGLVSGDNGNFQAPLGAVVHLYPVLNGTPSNTPLKDKNGTEVTGTVGAVQTNGTYQFNYLISSVPSGSYVATVTKTGFRAVPSVSAVFTVTPNTETRNINFTLKAPASYGRGIQLISSPLDYSGAGIDGRGIFGITSDLGAQYTQFSVATWNFSKDDYDISPTLPITIGIGYFVNFTDTASVARVDAAAFTGDSYSRSLTPGWNLIGHPFTDTTNPSNQAADLDLFQNAQVLTPSDPAPLTWQQAIDRGYVRGVAFGYTGSLTGSQYFQTSTIRAWQGYWLRNTAKDATGKPIQITLVLNRPATRSIKQLMAASAADDGKTRMRSIGSGTSSATNWRLQLAAKQGDLLDTDNSIGVAPGAADGYDNKFDTEKPPMMGGDVHQVYVSLDGKNESGRAAAFADDIRSGDEKVTRTWDFTVRANGQGNVTVYWPNAGRLPRGVEPVLVDTVTGKRVPMRDGGASSYTFTPASTNGGETSRHFQVEIAKPTSMPLAITNVKQTTVGGRASGAPSGVRFSFTVTRAADVAAEIQTLAGQTVQRIQTRATASTETAVTWDGRAQDGTTLPVGAYVLSLSAKDSDGHVTRVRLPLVRLR